MVGGAGEAKETAGVQLLDPKDREVRQMGSRDGR